MFKVVATAIGTVIAITVKAAGTEATGDRIIEGTDKDADTEVAAIAEGDITDTKEATETAGVAIEPIEAGTKSS